MDPFLKATLQEHASRLIFFAVIGALLAAFGWYASLQASPERETTAEIVQIGLFANKLGDRPILVRAPDGVTLRLVVPANRAIHCRVGGRMSVVRVGGSYASGLRGCDVPQRPES